MEMKWRKHDSEVDVFETDFVSKNITLQYASCREADHRGLAANRIQCTILSSNKSIHCLVLLMYSDSLLLTFCIKT